MRSRNAHQIASAAVVLGALLFWGPEARAVPSFTRQTGLSCTACHTTFPELTQMGREFKLNGYTFSADDIADKGGKKESGFAMSKYLPLSLNARPSFTHTGDAQPGTRNPNFEIPQQVNFWLAGKLAEHLGSYIQMTYSVQGDHFGFDNSDFRFAKESKLGDKKLTWGLDFNNNPTFEDLWNSTPAYGFPWAAPDAVLTPAAGTIIDGGLSGDIVGLGGYAMWNDHLYVNVTGYRSQHTGEALPSTGKDFGHNIKGVAPYWRVAWQTEKEGNLFMLGTYGIHVESFPHAISGPTDTFTDFAGDLQLEHKFQADLLTVHATFIYEKQALNATFLGGGAAAASLRLHTFRADAGYHLGNRVALTGGGFLTTGTADSVLYAPAALTGSANGDPKTSGFLAQLAYFPVQNVELAAQYKGYFKFNGGSTNYDGSGRDASGNNVLYVFAWICF